MKGDKLKRLFFDNLYYYFYMHYVYLSHETIYA